jgi:hypothetical protein
MTQTEAIELLRACKPLTARLTAASSSEAKSNLELSKTDLEALRGFARVQADPISAGPGLLGKLLKAAELDQVEISRLNQLIRVLAKRHF